MNKKILLSTDIGSDMDDALALLVMLNHPGINLKGIYTVNGDVDSRSYIAKHMVNLAKRKIPVLRGESLPLGALVGPYSHLENYLIDNSFINDKKTSKVLSKIYYKSLTKCGIIPNGTENLAERLSKSHFTIFSIAPMTGIALILKNYPKSAQNIDALYIMGANFTGTLEHNFRFDSVAAREVLASNLPITIIPNEVCARYQMPVKLMNNVDSSVGKYVNHMLKAFVGGEFIKKYRDHSLGGEALDLIIRNHVKLCFSDNRDEATKQLKMEEKKKNIIENWDIEAAYCEAEIFLKDVCWVIEQLRNPRNGYWFGELTAQTIESLIPQEIFIHDVFIPYCFLHPERLKTKKMTIDCDIEGRTYILKGEKHEVINDLDFNHFKEFINTYLK